VNHVDEHGNVGLFIAPDKAVAVWTGSEAGQAVLDHLCITPSEEEPGAIALQAARAVRRQGIAFEEVFIAIDCSYYTQYNLHSEFEDYHQIESTIKFDAEEAAATDAMNLAVTFDVIGKMPTGSEVTVYTADRQLLTDILLDVQEGGLDPTLIEPDVSCLAQLLLQSATDADKTDTLFVVLSQTNCYMIRPQADFAPRVRTFLIGKGQDVTHVLSRECMLATSVSGSEQRLSSVVMLGQTETVDVDTLAQQTGLAVRTEQPPQVLAQALTESAEIEPHEMMIAYGAALAARSRGRKTDFRRDFMPYQGRRKALEGSLRLIAISVTVLMVAVGIFFQLKALRVRRDAGKLYAELVSEYKAVTYGKKPTPGMSVTSSLKRELSRAKQMEAGIGPGDDKSVPAKLTYFFEAINNTPKNVDINIRQVTVTERSMTVKGDTNSQSGTMALVNKIKEDSRITINGERYTTNANRHTFQFNIEPKQAKGSRR
jgi:hypothetical protein